MGKLDITKINHHDQPYEKAREFGDISNKSLWFADDVNHDDDLKDINSMPTDVANGVKRIIDFFAKVDELVFANISCNFIPDFDNSNIEYAYTAIKDIEHIHTQSYNKQLISISNDVKEKEEHMNAYINIPSIKAITEFAIEYTDNEKYSLEERLIAFFCFEGILFTSAFAFIFWIRKEYNGKLKGIVTANNYISRDENLHCEFAAYLINDVLPDYIGRKVSKDKVYDIFTKVNILSDTFIDDFITTELPMMNKSLMRQHVRHISNIWLSKINISPLYTDVKDTPFLFIENISLVTKNNFFEQKGTEYQKCKSKEIDWVTAMLKEIEDEE